MSNSMSLQGCSPVSASQSRIEALIEVLQMYNALSPSDQAELAKQIKADESSKPDLTFHSKDTKFISSLDAFYDFPRAVLDLAKSKTHVPLTLLTNPAIKKLHAGEDIASFPPEKTISVIDFYEASYKFIDLMSLVASPGIVKRFKAHQEFCLARMERFRTVVAFDIETRRMFFNMGSFLEEDAYVRRWRALDMDIHHQELRERIDEAFHPYSKSMCLICGRTGHKASECTDWYTVKEEGVVCEWDGTLVLKSTSEVVCMLFNVGRCSREHGRVHVCSICGSQGHDARRCC